MTNADLFMTLTEHEAAVRAAGFATVDLLVEKRGWPSFGPSHDVIR
jgi:hypothetical protein